MSNNNYKKEIFDRLSKGKFICSNSSENYTQRLYNYIEEDFDNLSDFFSEIGYKLSSGEEYFYFSRFEEKASIEYKLEQTFKWIDILDFFKSYDNVFGSGFRFQAHSIATMLKVNTNLKSKLKALKKYSKSENELEAIQNLVKELQKDGYVELENKEADEYKVLSSFNYLENLILSINLSEEIVDEISE